MWTMLKNSLSGVAGMASPLTKGLLIALIACMGAMGVEGWLLKRSYEAQGAAKVANQALARDLKVANEASLKLQDSCRISDTIVSDNVVEKAGIDRVVFDTLNKTHVASKATNVAKAATGEKKDEKEGKQESGSVLDSQLPADIDGVLREYYSKIQLGSASK